ncbi:hypothetical protein HYPSUDRAFT_205201 [Hypholoma sublateritium FD-334 SS-4]|uniref:Uncharacterized protein n=1 Tax=Hypholoma sublateritium (strain FD-334 SS-4) TaxID=945553 RepID=A0A0D2NPL1_HYPSF|nr:hypothetical protein HYPSUDRAFT_205201 [Hypholoma sublateritium FD-334 SS-4]
MHPAPAIHFRLPAARTSIPASKAKRAYYVEPQRSLATRAEVRPHRRRDALAWFGAVLPFPSFPSFLRIHPPFHAFHSVGRSVIRTNIARASRRAVRIMVSHSAPPPCVVCYTSVLATPRRRRRREAQLLRAIRKAVLGVLLTQRRAHVRRGAARLAFPPRGVAKLRRREPACRGG